MPGPAGWTFERSAEVLSAARAIEARGENLYVLSLFGLHHWDGKRWHHLFDADDRVFGPQRPSLVALSPRDIWIAANGKLFHWNGNSVEATDPGLVGAEVRSLWGDGTRLIAVTNHGLHELQGRFWRPVFGSQKLRAATGYGDTGILAVGDEGAIFERRGTAWIRHQSGTNADLRAVTTLSGGAWAVGDGGTVLGLGPTGWSRLGGAEAAQLTSIGLDRGIVVVGGQSTTGLLLRWDGTRWEKRSIGHAAPLLASNGDVLWVAPGGSPIERWQGGCSEALEPIPGGVERLFSQAGRLWSVGWNGIMRRERDGRWSTVHARRRVDEGLPLWRSPRGTLWSIEQGALARSDGGPVPDRAHTGGVLAGTSDDDVWIGGRDATIHHWDGKRATSHRFDVPVPDAEVQSIWISSTGEVWAAVSNFRQWPRQGGVLGKWDGKRWSVEPLPGNAAPVSILPGPGREPWVLARSQKDYDAILMRRERGVWTPHVLGTDLQLTDVAVAEGELWALDELPALLRRRGDRWQSESVPLDRADRLYGDARHLLVAGERGGRPLIARRSRGRWTDLDIGFQAVALSVDRSGDIWIVGAGGNVARWNGRSLAKMNVGAGVKLVAVWSDGSEAWAGTEGGELYRYREGSWRSEEERLHWGQLVGFAGDDRRLVAATSSGLNTWNGERWSFSKFDKVIVALHMDSTGVWVLDQYGGIWREGDFGWEKVGSPVPEGARHWAFLPDGTIALDGTQGLTRWSPTGQQTVEDGFRVKQPSGIRIDERRAWIVANEGVFLVDRDRATRRWSKPRRIGDQPSLATNGQVLWAGGMALLRFTPDRAPNAH